MCQNINTTVLPCERNTEQKQKVEDYNGIRIYPLRCGVYRSNYLSEDLISFTKSKNNENNEIKQLIKANSNYYPELKDNDYFYHIMPLREGWLYLYSEEGKGVYEFFFNGSTFAKKNFLAKEKKEKFWIVDTGNGPYLSLSDKDKIKLFYSDVRLTEKCVIEKFLENKQDRIVNSFDCNWDGKTSIERRQIDTADISSYGCYPVKSDFGYDEDYIAQYDSYIETAYFNNEEKETNRDVFFILDDAIGVTKQLQFDLEDIHLNHEAFVRSIRTGTELNLIKGKILSYAGTAENGIISDEKLLGVDYSHYSSIHTLGIMLYNLLYLSGREDSFIKKAKRASDENRIKEILAVAAREKLRNDIEDLRKTLDEFINSNLFQKYCEFFNTYDLQGGNEKQRELHNKMLVEVKLLIISSYQALSVLPHSKDSYIDGTNENYVDLCENTFKDVIDENNESGKLLNKEINIEELGRDFNEKTEISENIEVAFLLANQILISFGRVIFDPQNTSIKIKLFESNIKRGLFEVNRAELEAALQKISRRVADEGRVMQKAANSRYRFLKADSFNIEKNKFRILTESMISNNSSKIVKSASFAKYITQHPMYFSICSVFYLYSLGSIGDNIKNDEYLDAGISSAQLAVGVLSLRTLFLEKFAGQQLGITAQTRALNIGKLGLRFSKFVVIGFAIDLFDSLIKLRMKVLENDYDAAVFYGLAGFSAFVGGGVAIAAIIKSSALFGWVGLACAVLVVVFIKLAEYCSDTEMEKFINSTIFSKNYSYLFQYNGNIQNYYKDIQSLGTTYALSQAKEKAFMANYNYQIEEFLMCQLLVPYFHLGFRYLAASLIYAPGTYIPLTTRIDGISVSLELDLAYYNEQIKEIEIQSFYLMKKGKNDGYNLLPDSGGGELYNQKEKNKFYYNFVIRENKQRFFYREEAYILTYIRFYDEKGKILPWGRLNKKKEVESVFLIYRHKITVGETSWGSKQLDYSNAKVTLDRVKLGTWEEGLEKK